MDYGLYDIFYALYDYFSEVLVQFRRFLFTTGAGEIRNFKYFFFAGIPILFASFEAIFDWLIPTFTSLEPMGVRRFVSFRAERLKVPEVKSYTPFKSGYFRNRNRLIKPDIKFNTHELKHYQQLYQQRFNTTATPIQLKHFILSEGKDYTYLKTSTRYVANNKMKRVYNDLSDIGRGVVKNYKLYKKRKQEKE